jgi:23S rRNA (adenine2030-N6)-methyltransferase
MFSYRHAFHAGNHADVLKHSVLIAVLRHMLQKETPITVVDTHAGSGVYRLDDPFAVKSGESVDGIDRLMAAVNTDANGGALLSDYLELIKPFYAQQTYPGSPLIIQQLMRDTDKLRLFELHPTDSQLLAGNIAALRVGRQVSVQIADGFAGPKKFLPPPSRRGLVLCDPSYEMKSDYPQVLLMLADCLKRFATGTYMVWYPIIDRREALELPDSLKQLAQSNGKPWLHAQLMVKPFAALEAKAGLPGSGVFILNPPYTLEALLAQALPRLAGFLAQDASASGQLETG